MEKFRFMVVLDVDNFDVPTSVIEMVECTEGTISFDKMENIVDTLIGNKELIPTENGLWGTIIIDDDEVKMELDN